MLLGIQKEGQLVGRCDHVDHPLMLKIIVFFKKQLFLDTLPDGHLQFRTEILEHFGQGLSIHDAEDRNGTYKKCGDNRQKFLFHKLHVAR